MIDYVCERNLCPNFIGADSNQNLIQIQIQCFLPGYTSYFVSHVNDQYLVQITKGHNKPRRRKYFDFFNCEGFLDSHDSKNTEIGTCKIEMSCSSQSYRILACLNAS